MKKTGLKTAMSFQNGEWLPQECVLARESKFEILVGEEHFTINAVSPENLEEMAVGYLITEGVILGASDISHLEIDEENYVAKVICKKTERKDYPSLKNEKAKATWSLDDLQLLANKLDNPNAFVTTKGTHSAMLFKDGKILCRIEDVGRHNAMDKVIGWASLNKIDIRECLVFLSGRLPVEIVRKAAVVGVSVLASTALPTLEGADLAKEKKIALISISPRRGILKF